MWLLLRFKISGRDISLSYKPEISERVAALNWRYLLFIIEDQPLEATPRLCDWHFHIST